MYLPKEIPIEVKEVRDGIRPRNIVVAFGQNLLKQQEPFLKSLDKTLQNNLMKVLPYTEVWDVTSFL